MITKTLNTKTARKFVRDALSTTSGEVMETFTDKIASRPEQRKVSFRIIFRDRTERDSSYDILESICDDLADEGISAVPCCGYGPTYLRLYNVPFDG